MVRNAILWDMVLDVTMTTVPTMLVSVRVHDMLFSTNCSTSVPSVLTIRMHMQ